MSGDGLTVANWIVSDVTASTAADAAGIYGNAGTYARSNQITNCHAGISLGSCQNNMTSGCTTRFNGIADAGNNH